MTKQRKRRLEPKYIFRRFLLVAIVLALAGGGGWFAYTKLSKPSPAKPAQAPAEPVSKPEPEPAPEPTPEPEPEPEETQSGVSVGDWELLLVNPTNPMPENYAMELETVVDSYRVDARVADSVKRMFAQAKEDGITLVICSAYRSVEKQQELFAEKEQEFIAGGDDAQAAAAATATIIAIPGTSEHHTGLAMDIITPSYTVLDSGFAETPAFKWLDKNAHKFGFIMRFPEDKQDITKIIYEPWHYRYVGEHNAAVIKEKGLCLEEYIDYLNKPAPKPPEESEGEEPEGGETGEAEQ